MDRAAHAGVADEGRPVLENLFVGRLHVGVRAEHGRDPAVEITADRDFLARGFAMRIDDDDRTSRARIAFTAASRSGNGFSRIGCMKVRAWTLITPTFPFGVSSTIVPAPGAPGG